MIRALCILALVAVAFSTPAGAVQPDEILSDPVLEARAREISKELRCLVCQNQSIDDSDAPLARDLRLLVRERLSAGDSDDATMDFIVARYGDFVLLRPPFRASTLVLWIGPALILIAGIAGIAVWHRRRRHAKGPDGEAGGGADAAPLSDDERRRLKALLSDGDSR